MTLKILEHGSLFAFLVTYRATCSVQLRVGISSMCFPLACRVSSCVVVKSAVISVS